MRSSDFDLDATVPVIPREGVESNFCAGHEAEFLKLVIPREGVERSRGGKRNSSGKPIM